MFFSLYLSPSPSLVYPPPPHTHFFLYLFLSLSVCLSVSLSLLSLLSLSPLSLSLSLSLTLWLCVSLGQVETDWCIIKTIWSYGCATCFISTSTNKSESERRKGLVFNSHRTSTQLQTIVPNIGEQCKSSSRIPRDGPIHPHRRVLEFSPVARQPRWRAVEGKVLEVFSARTLPSRGKFT